MERNSFLEIENVLLWCGVFALALLAHGG